MKPLSQHSQEWLDEQSKGILDIAVRNDGKAWDSLKVIQKK